MDTKSFSFSIKNIAILLMGICIAIVITGIIASYSSISSINKVGEAWHKFASETYPKQKILGDIRTEVGYGGFIHHFKNFVLRTDEKYHKRTVDSYNQLIKYIDKYRAFPSVSDQEIKALNQFEKTIRSYHSNLSKAINLIDAGATQVEIDNSIEISDSAALEALNSLETALQANFDKDHALVNSSIDDSTQTIHFTGIGIPILMAVIGWLMGWFLIKVLNQMGGEPSKLHDISLQLQKGDLASIKIDSKVKSKGIMGAWELTIEKLKQIIHQAQEGAEMVNVGVADISANQNKIIETATKQSSALLKTTENMQRMTDTIKDNSQKASDANRYTTTARNQIEEGGEVVNQAVEAMNGLKESSERISDITSVIDDIAFQTNLLALNASVEAARAGDQGKGFAVVASEVRNLAQRSASAAKEIKLLIDDSVNKANDSTQIVNKAGEALGTIQKSIGEVDSLITEIDLANQEQTQGLDEINTVIDQLEHYTHENTNIVEEINETTSVMKAKAENLQEVIGFFQIEKSKFVDRHYSNNIPAIDDSHTHEGKDRRSKTRPWSNRNIAPNDEIDDIAKVDDTSKIINHF